MEHAVPHDRSACIFCRNFKEFELPDHLLEQLSDGRLVIFAGAGVSTEASTVYPLTLYEEIRAELNLAESEKPAFPTLMTMYCRQADGRQKLLQRLQQRFAYVSAFPELYRSATRFHRELSTIFYIDTIITTNWDDYFERECDAVPFVTPEDFSFWNVSGRKVFKIHGSINNYGSIIATEEDYRRARLSLNRGTLGRVLKLLLATKTIVYVGYSLADSDFVAIQAYIRRELKRIAPTAYIVSLDHPADKRFKSLGLTPIYTDGTYFLAVIKKHLENDGHYLPDRRFDDVPAALLRTRLEHRRLYESFRPRKVPDIVLAASYQDGLAHAFERALKMKKSGQYSHRCEVTNKSKNTMRFVGKTAKTTIPGGSLCRGLYEWAALPCNRGFGS